MTKRFTTYKQTLGHDISGVRPVMIPDEAGEWVSLHEAEHVAEQLKQVHKRLATQRQYYESVISDGNKRIAEQQAVIDQRNRECDRLINEMGANNDRHSRRGSRARATVDSFSARKSH